MTKRIIEEDGTEIRVINNNNFVSVVIDGVTQFSAEVTTVILSMLYSAVCVDDIYNAIFA